MPRIIRGLLIALALALVAGLLLIACKDDKPDGDGETPAADGSPAPAASPDGDGDVELERVTFVAGFKPQANLPFVGAYVADKKGFFAEQGLEVNIQHVTTAGENFRQLAVGDAQFSTGDAATVIERGGDDPPLGIVAIALIGQRGQQGFAVLEDSGIQSPIDWVGKRAGYKGSEPTPDFNSILNAHSIDPGDVETVRVGFEPQVLTEGEVDIFPVFLSNEPDTLRNLGYEVEVFQAADYGAPTLGLTYVTTQDYIQENPQIVTRFLKAVLRGIQYADENRDEAIDIVMEFAPEEDRDHMRFMMDTELEAAQSLVSEQNGIGFMLDEQWRRLHDYLAEFGGIEAPLEDVGAVYNDFFLRQAYDGGELNWP
jgi:ABC-type nitrate/sulfonate/bicarbonate transport system substrate-binding protein